MSATYNFTIQFSTHAEMTQHHEEYARFLAWRSARAATRDTDRRGRHVAAIHARARQMRERDPTQPYRILFRLAACQLAGMEDCGDAGDSGDADDESTVDRNIG